LKRAIGHQNDNKKGGKEDSFHGLQCAAAHARNG